MATLFSSITLSAPSVDPDIAETETFQMTAVPVWGGGGHGGNEQVDVYFEWGTVSGGPYGTIPASGSELTTADTNPVSVTASPTSATVTGVGAGTYYVRVRGVAGVTDSSAEQLVTVSAGAVTGDLAATDVTDTAALAGDVLVQGDVAATDITDSAAISGAVLVQGDLSATDSNDTFAATGSVSSGVSGDLAATDVTDTAAAAGTVLVQGAVAGTDVTDTAALAGSVIVQGDLVATDTVDTAAAVGSILVAGDLAVTDAIDAADFAGAVLVQGDLAGTDIPDVAAFTSAGTITGDLAATDVSDSAAMTGTAVVIPPAVVRGGGFYVTRKPLKPIRGRLRVTDQPDGARMSGTVQIAGLMRSSEAHDGMKILIKTDMTPVLIKRAATHLLLDM